MSEKTKTLSYLIPLAIIDAVIPLPIIGLLLVYVIFAKPPWFIELIERIYDR